MALTTADYGTLVDLVGAAVLVVLSAWVLRFKPRRRATIAFAASFGLYGLEYVLSNSLALAQAQSSGAVLAYMVLDAASLAAFVLLVLWYPRPMRLRERPARLAAAGAAVFALFITASMVARFGDFAATTWNLTALSPADRAVVVPAAAVGLPFVVFSLAFVTLVLPLRFRMTSPSGGPSDSSRWRMRSSSRG